MVKGITIGVTDCSKYANYANWLLEAGVDVIQLGYKVGGDIERCDGFLLTGGEDVHPSFYGKPELLPYCHAHDMDERRDEFELELLNQSEKRNIPVLGICRGLQIANVFFGGTLIPDIPSWGKPDHSKVEGKDRYHSIEVVPDSFLSSLVQVKSGNVNSAHHQSADKVGKGLSVNAQSTEGIVEGLEKNKNLSSIFFMLVQWHPERMIDQSSPLVSRIKESFLEAVRNNRSTYANH